MFNNISVKQKLWVLLGSAVLGLSALGFLSYIDIMKMDQYGKTGRQIEILKSDMLTLRRNEKDFILRKDLKYKEKFAKNFAKTVQEANSLKNKIDSIGLDSTEVEKFITIVKDYQKDFYSYIDKQVEIGLDEKKGLYGSLRQSVHNVQDNAKATKNFTLLASVYDLRKQEKDFMLRRDLKYVDKYSNKIEKLLKNNILVDENIKG
ncbi:MAG: hypothetical protein IE909_18100, partial [Campylobacterales bacterium]|nr:hypothetical protein [Campylobacterales bacterium]